MLKYPGDRVLEGGGTGLEGMMEGGEEGGGNSRKAGSPISDGSDKLLCVPVSRSSVISAISNNTTSRLGRAQRCSQQESIGSARCTRALFYPLGEGKMEYYSAAAVCMYTQQQPPLAQRGLITSSGVWVDALCRRVALALCDDIEVSEIDDTAT